VNKVVAVILGGGKGIRLQPLTEQRCKPAVPIGGNYRMVDIPISNCINSGIKRIYVLTQYRSASLNRHIAQTYYFDNFTNGFVDVLAADQSLENDDWFQGPADAVHRNLPGFNTGPGDDVLVMNGDILFRQDLRKVVDLHREQRADLTLLVSPAAAKEAVNFGLVKVDGRGQILDFIEKPAFEELQNYRAPESVLRQFSTGSEERPYLASIGVYVFRYEALHQLLGHESAVDFGHDVLPDAIRRMHCQAFLFDDYWQDLGTIRTFFQANLDLALSSPPFSFYDEQSPIYTRPRFLPPSKLLNCDVENSLISGGCLVRAARITNSIVGLRSIIRRDSIIEHSILMGADRYDTYPIFDKEYTGEELGIGEGTIIRNAIIDKDARIGPNCRITNEKQVQRADGELFAIRDGIIIVRKGAILPTGTVI